MKNNINKINIILNDIFIDFENSLEKRYIEGNTNNILNNKNNNEFFS